MGDDEGLGELTNDSEMMGTGNPSGSGAGLFGNRPLLAVVGVGVIIFAVALALFFRGGSGSGARNFIMIVGNLEPTDVALIRAELRYINIPSRTEGSGRNLQVLVPMKHRDQALDRLALRGLPAGDIKGYRLFDKQDGLGATDFDKRIKFIRALNGELALAITRFQDIEDARVQIVIPEKQMFSNRRSKVSASVLLKVKSGVTLDREQITGIAQLVASSVEDLSIDNVTIVDMSGYILHGPESPFTRIIKEAKDIDLESIVNSEESAPEPAEPTGTDNGKIVDNEEQPAELAKADVAPLPQKPTATEPKEKKEKKLSYKEKINQQNQFRKDVENQLILKSQKVLDHYLPVGSSFVKVSVELPEVTDEEQNEQSLTYIISRSILILVDSNDPNLSLEGNIKKNIFNEIAAVVEYQYGSKDSIVLRKSPFYFEQINERDHARFIQKEYEQAIMWHLITLLLSTILLGIIYWIIRSKLSLFIGKIKLGKPKKSSAQTADEDLLAKEPKQEQSSAEEISPELQEIRDSVQNDPTQIARLIKGWLEEEMP